MSRAAVLDRASDVLAELEPEEQWAVVVVRRTPGGIESAAVHCGPGFPRKLLRSIVEFADRQDVETLPLGGGRANAT